MKFLQNAVAAVQRNATALLIYAAGILIIQSLRIGVDHVLTGGLPVDPATLSTGMRALELAITLCLAPLSAAVSAVAFARIGKEMDRPLWRSPNDGDALRRFFQLWFVLILLSAALETAMSLVQSFESAIAMPLFLLYLLLNILTVPVGACVMFSGAVQWKELGKNLIPLAYQFPRTLLLCLLTILQVVMAFKVLEVRLNPEAGYRWLLLAPVVTVIGAYIDCVVFAGAWLMCTEHRNSDQDSDFEF